MQKLHSFTKSARVPRHLRIFRPDDDGAARFLSPSFRKDTQTVGNPVSLSFSTQARLMLGQSAA